MLLTVGCADGEAGWQCDEQTQGTTMCRDRVQRSLQVESTPTACGPQHSIMQLCWYVQPVTTFVIEIMVIILLQVCHTLEQLPRTCSFWRAYVEYGLEYDDTMISNSSWSQLG